MKSISLIVISIVATFGYTQGPDTLWTKTYGGPEEDVGNSIQQTSNGGYIITGYTASFGAGQQDVWLLKTDANGDTLWTKTFGGAGDDWAAAVRYTTDGGYIIAANTESFGAGGNYIWLIRTDSLGDTIWTNTYGIYGTWQEGLDIQQTRDGGFIMTGIWPGYGLDASGLMLFKIDANGDSTWCMVYDSALFIYSRGFSVCETFDGGYTVAGTSGYPGWPIDVLMNTDVNGNINWLIESCSYGSPSCFRSVMQTADSGYVACGWGWNPWTLLIARTNSDGDTLWIREYGDSAFGMSGNSVLLTNDNGYIIAGTCWANVGGYITDNLFLLKMDANGDSLWCVVYGESGYPNERGNEVLQTNDDYYIVVGYTESFGTVNGDVWLLKFERDDGVKENKEIAVRIQDSGATIFSGLIQLPEDKNCKVFDITGRVIEPTNITRGIYFIEVDGAVTQKVVKVR